MVQIHIRVQVSSGVLSFFLRFLGSFGQLSLYKLSIVLSLFLPHPPPSFLPSVPSSPFLLLAPSSYFLFFLPLPPVASHK
jgi:hypothetical protein